MNRQKRASLIYGNCQVYSPDGTLMFRCLEKKIKWYLDRNLAVKISEDPLSIKLTFEPKGKGERQESLKLERENKCVVCGTTDLHVLTKHHLIPYEYRQHFSHDKKSHNSLLVVPICRSCHSDYESNHANKLKAKLAETYNAPINGFAKNRSTAFSSIKTLLNHSSKLPPSRLEELKKATFDYLDSKNIEYQKSDLDSRYGLTNLYDFLKAEEEANVLTHGKIVVSRCESIEHLERIWVNNFLESTNSAFIPEYLKEIGVKRT